MDIHWGYNNIHIKEGNERKAVFKTELGFFKLLVMFFGLTNSPATFQAIMNDIFRDMINEGVISVYMDNILVHIKDLADHHTVVNQVLSHLQQHDLYLKPEKCLFKKDSIEFLALIILENTIAIDPIKVAGVLEWPVSTSIWEVQVFLGFANFYHQFVKDFSGISTLLFALTQKDTPWQ